MRTLIIIQLLIFVSCQQTDKKNISNNHNDTTLSNTITNVEEDQVNEVITQIDHEENIKAPDFCDTLGKYFKKFKITPIIDNAYNDGNDTTSTFIIGNHIVVWKYNDSLTNVKIDGQKINISKEGFDGPYSIGGIRLFSINKIEILAVEFYVVGCGGNCFGGNSLFYDFQNKSTNYFSYEAMNCFSLYDFKGDNTIDLLVPTFSGEFHGPFYEKYTLYQLNSSGRFTPKKDEIGNEYFVKIFYSERAPEVECEKSETNWFEQID